MKKNLSSLKTHFLGSLAGAVLIAGVATASADTVAHYRFEDGSAGIVATTAVDSTLNMYDMPAVESPVYSADVPVSTLPATGDSNSLSMDFSGGNHRFAGAIDDAMSQVVFNDFTLEAWIRHTGVSGPQTYIGRDDQGGTDSGARLGSGHALVYFQKGGNNQVRIEVVDIQGELLPLDSGFFPEADVWYHVAAVGDATAGTLSIYVDGVLLGQRDDFTGLADPVAQGTTGAATPWTVGRGQWAGNPADFFNGQLDEVRVSNSALTPADFLNFSEARIELLSEPADLVVWAGQDVTFTTEAVLVGAGELDYQWEVSLDDGATWSEVVGAVSPSYTIPGASAAVDGNLYRAQISSGALNVTSESALLRVGDADPAQPRGLVAHYRFEDGTLGATAEGVTDLSGNGNDLGEWIGTPAYTDAIPVTPIPQTGADNNLSLDVSGGQFAVQGTDGDPLSLIEWTDFTLEAWVKFDDLGGFQTVVGRDDRGDQRPGSAAFFYFQKTSSNDFRLDAYGRDGQNHDVRGGSVAGGVWHHVAAVGDVTAGTLTLYLNGNVVDSDDNFTGLFVPGPATRWSIGRGQYGADDSIGASQGDWVNGQIDEVRFSNVALGTHEFLTFNSAVLRFAEQPQDITAAVEDEVVFTSLAAGGGQDALTYQWQISEDGGGTWANVPGASDANLTIASVAIGQNGNQYRVVASRGTATEVSGVATLSVFGFPAPVVTENGLTPGLLGIAGEEVTFNIAATGLGNITYQWQEDGIDLPGETGTSLTFSPLEVGDEGTYSVVIQDDAALAEGLEPATTTVSTYLAVAPRLKGAISLNFVGSGSGNWGSTAELAPIDPNEVAGAVPVGNWNNSATENWISNQATPLALVNDNGAATAVTATWSAANTWSARANAGPPNAKEPNQRIFHGFIEARQADGDPATVTISNIPYETYDVYVYPMGAEGAPGTFGRSVTMTDANGTRELFMRNLSGNPAPETIPFVLSHATTLEEAENSHAASYFRFAGASGGTVELQHFDRIDWNSGGFAAISIVDTTVATPARPKFVSRPSGSFLPSGSTATLSAAAEPMNINGSLSFRWEKDGVEVGTGAELSISNVSSADNGEYTVIVTETSDLGISTNTAITELVVTDATRPVLISAEMQANAEHAEMMGNGILRLDGPVTVDPATGDTNPNGIGEGTTIWNRLALGTQGRTYMNLVDSEGLGLSGLTFTATGATGSEDNTVSGAITNPIEESSGPLLRDYIMTQEDDVMTLTVGGMQALAGREVTLVVYAIGKESTEWELVVQPDVIMGQRNDVSRVTLAAQNSLTGQEEFGDTDQVEGRDLAYNNLAFVTFDAVVAANGTVSWTVGPVPGEPGLNAFNGFQLLVTDGGEGIVLTALQTWRQENFGSIDDIGDAANTADPDGDGVNNLLEYALGSNPNVAGDALGAVTSEEAGGFLTLSFNHVADANLSYAIEASDNLDAGWTVVETYGSFNASGVQTYTDTVSVGTAGSRFLRLNVTVNQ